MPSKNAIQKSKHFSQLTNIAVTEETNKSNCKFCQSKFRKEAEKVFSEKNNNIMAAHRFLKDNGEDISYLSVRNHLQAHYLRNKRRLLIKEWAEDLDQYAGGISDKRHMILERIAIMRREIVIIAAESDSLSMDERRKSADIIKKLSDGMSGLEEKLEQIDMEFEPVEIVVSNLQSILAQKIRSTTNDEVKKALLDVLDDLAKNVSEIMSVSAG